MHVDWLSNADSSGTQTTPRSARNLERRAPRFPAHQLVWLVRESGAVSCATMINVSRKGFGLRVSSAPASGERVILRGGAGDIPAEIRWSDEARAGGLFMLPDD